MYKGKAASILAGGMGVHRDMVRGMMGGVLPLGVDPIRLPQPDSSGAHLLGEKSIARSFSRNATT